MERVLMDDVVETDYGQLDIVWSQQGGFDGHIDGYFAGQVNGLVGAAHEDGVYLVLGRRSGGSQVRVELLDSVPGEPDRVWEDVVEVSLTVVAGRRVQMLSWAAESSWDLDLPAGSYRLRVSARGRDAGADGEFADGLVDRYVLQLWPSPPAPDAILRVGSADARYWHTTWGSRRDA